MLTPRPKVLIAEIAETYSSGDIRRISELKGQAEALFLQAAKMEPAVKLDYQEAIRRAERALGLLIRDGQRRGVIRTKGDNTKDDTPSPSSFLDGRTRKSLVQIYDLCESGDAEFEAAIQAARAAGACSRAEMIRKLGPRPQRAGTTHEFTLVYDHEDVAEDWVPNQNDRSVAGTQRRKQVIREMAEQGYSSRQMEERLGTLASTIRNIAARMGVEIPADQITYRTRHHNSDRIVGEMASTMEGLAMSAQLVEAAGLDKSKVPAWIASLTSSVRIINQMVKEMREETS